MGGGNFAEDKNLAIAADAKPWDSSESRPFLTINDIRKTFSSTIALDCVNQDIYQGEFFAILGGSGSGKSTLLRIIAGLEQPDSGRIIIDGIDYTNVPAYKRPVNMMFQSYALFPHMSVDDNIAYGLRREGMLRSEIKDRVSDLIALLKLDGLNKRKPHQLSGGQKQRVALARALAKSPKLVLLDEPLGALDKKLREKTQFELVQLQEKLNLTFVFVTHDQEEAMTLATRIAVMDHGKIMQVGEPFKIYNAPNSEFVADFIGSTNIFNVEVTEASEDKIILAMEENQISSQLIDGAEYNIGDKLRLSLRPESIRLMRDTSGYDNSLPALIIDIAFAGDRSIYLLQLNSGRQITVSRPNRGKTDAAEFSWDEEVFLCWQQDAGVLLAQ